MRKKGIVLETYVASFSGLTKTQEKARFQHSQMLSPTSRSKEQRLRSILRILGVEGQSHTMSGGIAKIIGMLGSLSSLLRQQRLIQCLGRIDERLISFLCTNLVKFPLSCSEVSTSRMMDTLLSYEVQCKGLDVFNVSKRHKKLNTTGCFSLSINKMPNEGKYDWKTLVGLTLNYCNFCYS